MTDNNSEVAIAPALPSSTLVLARDSGDDSELFMVKRTPKAAFAPGALVFPGGVLEEEDSLAEWQDYCDISQTEPELLAWQIAAIRETWEESAILLARREGSEDMLTQTDVAALEDDRYLLNAAELGFLAFVKKHQLRLCCNQLHSYARWITPEKSPKRFDTLFFLAPAPADQSGKLDGAEIVETAWLPTRQVLDYAQSGEYQVVFATEMNVLWVSQRTPVVNALEEAIAKEVLPVMAEVHIEGEKVYLRIPEAAGYGVTQREWKM